MNEFLINLPPKIINFFKSQQLFNILLNIKKSIHLQLLIYLMKLINLNLSKLIL